MYTQIKSHQEIQISYKKFNSHKVISNMIKFRSHKGIGNSRIKIFIPYIEGLAVGIVMF